LEGTKDQRLLTRLNGYLLIPHELLHVLGYRLVGQVCRYGWGEAHVTPIGSMTRFERLVGTLFPFAVFVLAFVFCAILSGLAYLQFIRFGEISTQFIFWTGLALITGIYAGTAITDLRRAYLLIFNKPWYARTPFDVFFWPLIDWEEVRQKIASGEINN
jgi:hypothetical protein